MTSQTGPRASSMSDIPEAVDQERRGDIPKLSQSLRSGEGGARPKTQRPAKQLERTPSIISAKLYGIKVYAPETKTFPKAIKYEDIIEGLKNKKYKVTFKVKKSETEIIELIEQQKVKFSEGDFTVVPDDVFKKIRQGQEQSPQQQQTTKKPTWNK